MGNYTISGSNRYTITSLLPSLLPSFLSNTRGYAAWHNGLMYSHLTQDPTRITCPSQSVFYWQHWKHSQKLFPQHQSNTLNCARI